MNTKEIGQIVEGGNNVETLERTEDDANTVISALKALIEQQATEIENLRRENKFLFKESNENKIQREYATAMAVVLGRKQRKTLSNVNRNTMSDLKTARGKIEEYSGEFFDTLRKLGTAEAHINELEELRAKTALGLLAEYQAFFNSLYGDERLWTSMQRRVLGILKRSIDHAGLIIINPAKNICFNHKRHSVKPVSDDGWRGELDESEKNFDGATILECVCFGIKEQDGLYQDESGINREPRFFKRAQVTLQQKK